MKYENAYEKIFSHFCRKMREKGDEKFFTNVKNHVNILSDSKLQFLIKKFLKIKFKLKSLFNLFNF